MPSSFISEFTTITFILVLTGNSCLSQIDTSLVYNSNTAYGKLDLRIAKSSTSYYYLNEGKTFSYRESSPGVRTDNFLDMVAWNLDAYTQGNLREKNVTQDLFVMNYRLLLPQNYNAAYSNGYPIILALHGAAESANCWYQGCYHGNNNYSPNVNVPQASANLNNKLLNNDNNLLHGGKEHLDARNLAGNKLPDDPSLSDRAFPGFVLYPQSLNGWDEHAVEDAIRIVRLISKRYNIDENRIYLEGVSNGGHGAYEALKRAPWMFACAIAMSAIDDAGIISQNLQSSTASIPLWIFQGALDDNPKPNETEGYINKFRNAGQDIRYSYYNNLGHGTWNAAYDEPDFFSWMLNKNKSSIHSFGGKAELCLTSQAGLKLELPNGHVTYQWEYNGNILGDAQASTYAAKLAGNYRARYADTTNPTEGQWNRWSEVLEVKATVIEVPKLEQSGTVLLNDLNDGSEAHLYTSKKFAHYFWYKDGVQQNFPGTQDDTIRYVSLKSDRGNGMYAVAVADFDNCLSPSSEGKAIFFKNSAPINLTTPSGFAAVTKSASAAELTWSNNSTNTELEIWRRTSLEQARYTAWQMATLTLTDASVYTDQGLNPSTKYEYKIRAVNKTGRSNYYPSAQNETISVITKPDTESPSSPQNLSATLIGVRKISLSWNRSKDNTTIHHYVIYYNTDTISTVTADTTYTLSDLELNIIYNLKVKAVDVAGNFSAPGNIVQKTTYMSGLYYEHSTGAWTGLNTIDWTKPEYTGVVKNFSTATKTQQDYFYLRFDGFLFINQSGIYHFKLISNDGSRLKLNDTLRIDNDGIHEMTEVSSEEIILSEGAQHITVDFFDYTEQDSLVVQYLGADTGNEWITIPNEALKSNATVISEEGEIENSEILVSVYPNPVTQNEVNIKITSSINSSANIILLDPVGRVIMESDLNIEQVLQGITIQTENLLSSGMYIVIVQQQNKIARQRLVINKNN